MNILFIGYWGANDGLSVSTIFPHLKILAEFKEVVSITYVSLEREEDKVFNVPKGDKIIHLPIYIESSKLRIWNKFKTFLFLPKEFKKIARDHTIDFSIARSSLAGYFAHKLYKSLNIPYVVESFEPHADYMLESRVWSKRSLSYFLNKRWEQQQILDAKGLIPVSRHFQESLIKLNVSTERMSVVPCTVDNDLFKFSVEERIRIRKSLGLREDQIVGIYVGKFGGNYLDKEAFRIFKWASEEIDDFFLLILSPQSKSSISSKLEHCNFPDNSVFIDKVEHHQVASFLSASDFAFATYSFGPFKKFLSPIKVGEYWGNGLPVLLTKGVGDDSDIIEKIGHGSVFIYEENNVKSAIRSITEKLDSNSRFSDLGERYRNQRLIREAYVKLVFTSSNL